MSRQSLADALAAGKPADVSARAEEGGEPQQAPVPIEHKEPVTRAAEGYVPPSRVGKRKVMAHVDPEVLMQLKLLGLDLKQRTIQSMLTEALNDFFVKHGRPPIA